MAATEHFDVIVIGRSLAGLLTAALLARRKYRVRVMDCADAAPLERVPLFGDTSRAVVRVLDELGLQHDLRTRLDGAWKPVTLALPDRRGTLPTTLADRGRELAELFGSPRLPALVELFERVEAHGESLDPMLSGDLDPPFGWRARRRWSAAVDGVAARRLGSTPWVSDPALRPMIAALLRVAGQNDTGDGPMTPRGARAIWHLCHGVVPIRGGRAGFARMVVEKLEVLGAALDRRERPRPADAIEVHRKRAKAVVGLDGIRLGAEVVILAGGEPDLARLWPSAPPHEAVRGHRLSARVPARDRAVDLRDPCGWVPRADGPAHLVRVADDRVVVSWVGEGPPPLDRLLPFAEIDEVETAPLPFPTDVRHEPLGLYTRPYRSPLKNVLYVGEWVLPGLGLEGACLTALQAAAEVERVGPKRPR